MNVFGFRKSPIAGPADFQAVYERERLAVFRYIYSLTGGPQEEAEDLTAETFLRAWKARHRFEGDAGSAIGWLIRIAKRLVIDNHRRSRHAIPGLAAEFGAGSTPEQTALNAEQKRLLSTLLADLPDEPREILILRYMLGWRVSDIAAHLGATENNVSVIIHRTLSRLRQRWLEYDAEYLTNMFVMKEQVP